MMRTHVDSAIGWIIVAFVLWFGSYLYLQVFTMGGPKPLYSYVLLLGFAITVISYVVAIHQRLLPPVNTTGVVALLIWLALYLVYGVLEFLHSTQDEIALQAFITLGEAVLLSGALALLMSNAKRLRKVQGALAFLALVDVIINFYDFFIPTFTFVPGRAAGLYVNPNISGHFIAMAMVAGLGVIARRWRLPYLLICGIGVLVTFSRAAWIIWGVAIIWSGWQGYFGSARQRLVAAVLAVFIGVGFTGMLFAGKIGGYVAQSSLTQYLTPNTAARLGIGASVLSGHAASVREGAIKVSLNEADRSPWIGHGLGYTDEWHYPVGPHDMYLLFLVDGGIPGLALYLLLIALLWRYSEGFGRLIAVQLAVASFFTHNQLQQPAFLIMMAFVIAHRAAQRELSVPDNSAIMFST